MKRFFKENFDNFQQTFIRFPISIVLGFAVGILMCLVVNDNKYSENIMVFVSTLFVALFLFIFIELLNDKFNKNFTSVFSLLTYGMGIILTTYIYFIIGRRWNMELPKVYIYFLGLVFMFITLSLIVEKYDDPINHEFYVFRIIRSLIISSFLSFIVWLGFTLIIFALFSLFGLKNMYLYILRGLILCLGSLNLLLFLNNFPSRKTENLWENPTLGKKILKNILIPIELIFSLILIAYFIKILFQGVMPLRIVSYLALLYGILAFFIIFFSFNDKYESKKLIRYYFPISSLSFLGLMFYTMGNRINLYGFTENRYYVVIIGIYLCIFMIFNLLFHKKHNILTLLLLSIFILLSTFGPINSYNTSLKSQIKRLETILSKYDIDIYKEDFSIKDFNLEKMSTENKMDLKSILEYLNFRDELREIGNLKNIDVNNLSNYDEFNDINDSSFINLNSKFSNFDISEFNKIYYIEKDNKYGFTITYENEKVVFKLEDEKFEYDLSEIKDLSKDYNTENLLVFDFNYNGLKTKVIVNSLSLFSSFDSDEYVVDHFSGFLLQ
ncbi:MAG: DUF4153 domain-containing protein [Lagierella massiliensis]|nr:DUF4153 domain-containing protein [Lagierella massiliensis]